MQSYINCLIRSNLGSINKIIIKINKNILKINLKKFILKKDHFYSNINNIKIKKLL